MTDKNNLVHTSLIYQMTDKYGPLLSGEELWRSLGFKNYAAFRKARSRGYLTVHVFPLPNRKGLFALTSEVAEWLAELKKETDM